MFKWVSNKLVPTLLQAHKVMAVAEISIQYVLDLLGTLQISTESAVWDSVRTISNAINTVKNAVEKIENDIKSVITDETTISDFINQTKIIYKDLKILFTTIDDDRSRSWIGFEMSKSFTHVLTNINNFKFFKSIYFS